MYDLDSILNQVKNTETKEIEREVKGTFEKDERFLSLKVDNTYTFRFVPYVKDGSKTFASWKEVQFKSRTTGKYIYGGRSPMDAGVSSKEDLYNETQWAEYNVAKDIKNEAERKVAVKESCSLIGKRFQAGNIYLVKVDGNDEDSKKKVGTNLLFKYPAQVKKDGTPTSTIYTKIFNALSGDRASKIGTRLLDLSERGTNMVIKVVKNDGGYHDYEIDFDFPETLNLSKEDIARIHENAYDTATAIPALKSKEEIKKIMDEHWFGTNASSEDEVEDDEEETKPSAVSDDDDDLPGVSDDTPKDDLDDVLNEL